VKILKVDKWENKTLICMAGIPYSGKSTMAKEIAAEKNAPIVCPDCIRVAIHGCKFIPSAEGLVWAIAKIMVSSLFLTGIDNVILDATNTTPERRKEWMSSKWNTVFYAVDTSKEECIKRAKDLGDYTILPIIEKMFEQKDFNDICDSC